MSDVIVRNFASECEFETAVKGVNIRHYETLTLSNETLISICSEVMGKLLSVKSPDSVFTFNEAKL